MISIKTGNNVWDGFWPLMEGMISKNRVEIEKNGVVYRGYHSPDCPWLWFRDCIHYMLATMYIDPDIRSAVDLMLGTQQDDGSYLDFIRQDGSMLRVPTEADLEYLAVIGTYRAWLASGDDSWLEKCVPRLVKGIDYMTSHPWRWDEEHGLPKRAYTIDTWDFDIREGLEKLNWPGFIDEKTHFGIMHGDVSGLFQAYRLLGEMVQHLGDADQAKELWAKAEGIKERANKLLWNGKFYMHRYPLDDFRVDGLDESSQLSLSNSYDLNRGLPDPEMARSIIREYMRRRDEGQAFAEWYSIDPPFPIGVFGDPKLKPGVYVNGGIMPLVGGELARAAFRYGFDEYGLDILKRYYEMVESSGEAYLWYFPDGRHATKEESTSPEAYASDPWGASAMAGAFIQGLVGIRAGRPSFGATWFEPKWHIAGIDHAEVKIQYAASGAGFEYAYEKTGPKSIRYRIKARSLKDFHIGLPFDVSEAGADLDGKPVDVEIEEWSCGMGTAFCGTMDGDLTIDVKLKE